MTSDRPYRDAMPDSVARRRLLEAAGSQFDANVVDAFLEMFGPETEHVHIPTASVCTLDDAGSIGPSCHTAQQPD